MKYEGTGKNVVVPNTYDINGLTYNVVASAFHLSNYYDGTNSGGGIFGIFYDNDVIESVIFESNVRILYSEGTYNYIDEGYTEMSGFNSYDYSENLFGGCSNLKSVLLPNTITNLTNTFSSSILTISEIPSSVTIMDAAFVNCTNLTGTIRIKSSNVVSVSQAFDGTTKPITVEVPAGSTTYTTFSNTELPSNVTLTTFNAS